MTRIPLPTDLVERLSRSMAAAGHSNRDCLTWLRQIDLTLPQPTLSKILGGQSSLQGDQAAERLAAIEAYCVAHEPASDIDNIDEQIVDRSDALADELDEWTKHVRAAPLLTDLQIRALEVMIQRVAGATGPIGEWEFRLTQLIARNVGLNQ